MFYVSFSLAGRTLTTTSTVYATSTILVVETSTVTTEVPPPQAIMSVTSVSFPSTGTYGKIELYDSGAVGASVEGGSLT